MSIAVTGADGFLGWHLRVRLRATRGVHGTTVARDAWRDPQALQESLRPAETIVHLAGVNRADNPGDVAEGNIELGQRLADAIVANERPVHLVYGNSTQAHLDNPYGRGKADAAQTLQQAVHKVGGSMQNVLLPNLFGEHGRPHYNSVTATFCHQLVAGGQPRVHEDRELVLLHAQQAAEALMRAADTTSTATVEPVGQRETVSGLLSRLQHMHVTYSRGEIPDLSDRFTRDLFNTYRSYGFPQQFPFTVSVRSDDRGDLFETVRSHGGEGQAFVSTTAPGAVRGEHYHLGKVERFFVLSGEAEISLRRLLHSDVVTYRVHGETPCFIDMPTMWTHNIRNIGSSELLTMFWANELLDPDNPDQYPERVRLGEEVVA